jgi:GTP-binding protein YchF
LKQGVPIPYTDSIPLLVRANDPIASVYGAFGKLMNIHSLQLSDIEQIMITGVGASFINKRLFGIPTGRVDEFMAIGNQFLANIRETDAIVHVVRAFEDDDVLHVMGAVDPVRDREVIEFELALADLSVVEKRLDRVKRASKTGDKDALAELGALERAFAPLSEGRALWHVGLSAADRAVIAPLSLLTLKPILYAANVTDAELAGHEGAHLTALRDAVTTSGEHAEVVPFSAKIEAELSELSDDDSRAFLDSLGLESAGLDRLIRAGYHLLGLQTYFTAGEPEVRAWTIHRGDTAPIAAGVIHTDFERGFIRAETAGYEEFVANGGWKGAREKGVVRSEGKEYVVQDGDVMLFRFNV